MLVRRRKSGCANSGQIRQHSRPQLHWPTVFAHGVLRLGEVFVQPYCPDRKPARHLEISGCRELARGAVRAGTSERLPRYPSWCNGLCRSFGGRGRKSEVLRFLGRATGESGAWGVGASGLLLVPTSPTCLKRVPAQEARRTRVPRRLRLGRSAAAGSRRPSTSAMRK